MENVVLDVEGMTCDHCVAAVRKSLEAVSGVLSAEVTLAPSRAVVLCDPSRVTVDRLTDATGKEGYPSAVAGSV